MQDNSPFTPAQLKWLQESQKLVDSEMQQIVDKFHEGDADHQTVNRNLAIRFQGKLVADAFDRTRQGQGESLPTSLAPLVMDVLTTLPNQL
ncbi:hypothetical protein PTTG_26221 [Puccinia triticina 1-1 BBBD Race 1]|uniref:Uncharacterized protein n=1 Tax=Puccinia triticina (isolate 1-1 / race 1 (BBBD)) TaxID=630390 RepID=A0A180GW24_PUCT1|nr:hypothetical protein PTTG_26221 [Puccinia triticina 1-1 BBBD Race 1]